ncbi:MAG TPA: metalloregulator ArsR/SmtB family transcription factor [Devosia sp.]|nr:metalloregulator ArsR/SmtB family transcription factor [Devosia sp.]
MGEPVTGFDDFVDIIKAAGEATRLRLLALLSQGELSVKDLTDILGQSQPRVSRHLKLLARAGLVVRVAEGSWAYFRIAETGGRADFVRRLVGEIDPEDPRMTHDRLALERVRKRHREQAEAYFSRIAASWDTIRSLHVPESALEAAIVQAVGANDMEHMIDLGTGTGRMLELLCGVYRRGTGIDSSREMMAIARAKLAAASIFHAHVQLGDISRLEPDIGPADLITLHQVLHYFDDPGTIIEQAAPLLRKRGRMLIVDFAPHELEFLRKEHAHRRLGLSQGQMEGWAGAAGLEISGFEAFPKKGAGKDLTACLWVLSST